ncbi:MAG: aminoacyl-tRNA hydrolase, partial [Planctomycetota bacterium]
MSAGKEREGPILIAGLGNPGARYAHTRHNVGFMVLDKLAEEIRIPFEKEKFSALYGRGIWEGQKIVLVKPLTYMNLSGRAIGPLKDYFQVPLDSLLLVYDDLHLPLGKLRFRKKGSSGGHKGV